MLKSKANRLLNFEKAGEFILSRKSDLLSDINNFDILNGIYHIIPHCDIEDGEDLVWFTRILNCSSKLYGIEFEKHTRDLIFLIESEVDHVCRSPYYEVFVSDIKGELSKEEEFSELNKIYNMYIDTVKIIQNELKMEIRNMSNT